MTVSRLSSISTITRILFALLAVLFSSLACQAQQRIFATPADNPAKPTPVISTPVIETTPTQLETEAQKEQESSFLCSYTPAVEEMIQKTSADTWMDWVNKLSGADTVVIDGKETRITTRFTPAMFAGLPHARAYDYVLQSVREWYPADQIDEVEYTFQDEESGEKYRWKNLVITLPGETRPDEVVMLTAHLDSISRDDPMKVAPGAEDNGSGSAALLEAARILKDYRFERTLQIAWFTGEELGLLGSRAFVKQLDHPENIVGVINLDMFGFDSDNDRCFELHVGTLEESDLVGQCVVDSIDSYRLDLPRYDYLTFDAIDASDHGSFWEEGIGAVEFLEDMVEQDKPGGCPANDPNPGYHTPRDTANRINPESGIQIVRAALASIAGMARIIE